MWCGKSIEHMYEFLNKEKFEISIQKKIFQEALEGDEKCERVLQWFLRLYAREISNIALRYKAFGGMFLFGSISK